MSFAEGLVIVSKMLGNWSMVLCWMKLVEILNEYKSLMVFGVLSSKFLPFSKLVLCCDEACVS